MLRIENICENYQNFVKIGGGAFGKVYKAQNKKTLHYVAIKEIDKQQYKKENILKETAMMKRINCENSISVKEEIDSNDYYYIIMDLCEYNLDEQIKMRDKSVSIEEIKYILLQLNNVFKILNKEQVIHKDLKPSNILISCQRLDKSIIKLSDYGCSREVSGTRTFTGTLTTMAPEVINDEKDISKCDLWSLGVIIYYMYFNEYPYNGRNEHLLLQDINSGRELKKIDNEELNDLVRKLLVMDVKKRLSWEEYFNHSFFKNDEKEELIGKLKQKINLLENQLKVIKYNNVVNEELNSDKNLNNPLHILNNHLDWVKCLTILNDGRLVSGSEDKSIIIYNKQTYQPDIIINEHKNCVNCLTQLKNGILVSCSDDNTIKLFNIKDNQYELIQTLNLHSNYVNKILELSNNSLISGSSDSTIIFYIKDGTQYKKDYSISTSDSVSNIIQTKENEIVYSTNDGKLNFFDLKERKNISIIENIISSFTSFLMITNDLLFVSGKNVINIINVNDYKKIREIEILDKIRAVCKVNDIIVTGDDNGNLREWKIEGDNLINSKTINAHDEDITVVLKLDDSHIVSGSYDDTIKIWEFNFQ